MDLNKIKNYISEALKSGYTVDKIKQNLVSAGWSSEVIQQALNEVSQLKENVSNTNNLPSKGDIYVANESNIGNTGITSNPSIESSSRKKNTLVKVALGIAAVLIGSGIIYKLTISKLRTGLAPELHQQVLKTDLSKYNIDTDGDGYPDFVEIAVGSNQNENLYDKCYGNNPCKSSTLIDGDYSRDVLIILDSSGSMGLKIGPRTRMEEAKDAITGYVSSQNENVRFGLMVYGHKGSNNSSDKPISCSSAEIIKTIGTLDKNSVVPALAQVTPVGWTNMGTALNNAIPFFSSSTAKNKEIILVSDGAETCDSKPEDAARRAKESGIKVGVIGFAVDFEASKQLTAIANAGGGGFSVANNADELSQRFNDTYKNVQDWGTESSCLSDFVERGRSCYFEAHDKMFKYILAERSKLYTKEINQDEYDALGILDSKISENYQKIVDGELLKYMDIVNSKKDAAFDR